MVQNYLIKARRSIPDSGYFKLWLKPKYYTYLRQQKIITKRI